MKPGSVQCRLFADQQPTTLPAMREVKLIDSQGPFGILPLVMDSRYFRKLLFAFCLFGGGLYAEDGPPSVIYLLADDLGYGDLACYGAPDVKTPHIDKLASEGLRFTDFYGNGAECTPSRTSILTGRYPQRVGGLECAIGTGNVGRYDDAISLASRHDLGLPADHATLAPFLKKAGYYNGVFGKWHLGYEPKFNPLNQGFDEFKGFLGGNVDYFKHIELSDLPVSLNGTKPLKREGYMTHLITEDAVDFIGRQKPGTPYFLYLPFSAPHFPFQGPNDGPDMHPVDEWTAGTREKYIELLEDLDSAVGKVLAGLQDTGDPSNTLVVFASDHGAMKPGLNAPFRDYKGTLFEGGIRVPCIVRWPGKISPNQTSSQVGTLMDLTHSLLNLSGEETSTAGLDGIDILDHVISGKPNIERAIGWTAKRDDRVWQALRHGDTKLVIKQDGTSRKSYLFDIKNDPAESQPINDESLKKELEKKLIKWLSDLD